jgi:S1-C subfamily serine protease
MHHVTRFTPPSEILPAAALRRGLFCIFALVLAGCAGFPPTKDDQLRSLQELGQTKIAATLHFPELNDSVIDHLDARRFLLMVSVGVFTARDADAFARLEQMVALIAEGKTDAAQAIDNELIARRVTTHGSGVAVTGDGYIVTAAHAVRHPEVLVLTAGFAGPRAVARSVRARIVFADEKADFALLKCELATPRFLEIRPDAVPVGTPMFSGGWWNQSGAGRLLDTQESRADAGHSYRALRSSIPVLPGDSGSAVIDSAGRLLGVTVRGRYGRYWRQTPKSDAVILDPSELQRLIEQDRAKRP